MEINITDYLSHTEIKQIVSEQLKEEIRNYFKNKATAEILLSNLSYAIVREEINKIVPNYHTELVKKVLNHIESEDIGFHLFNYEYSTGKPVSLAAKIADNTITENKQLLKQKIIDGIEKIDYSDKALETLEKMSDQFASNIYDFVEIIKSKKK